VADGLHRRLRRAAILVVFAVGVLATAATSPATTTIDVAPAGTTFHLDPEHPAALSRIIVGLNPEATSGYAYVNVYLRIDPIRAAGGGAVPGAAGVVGPVRFIVASATPGAVPSPIATPLSGGEPVPTSWQAEMLPNSQVALPIDCNRAVGPCERAFWLIAQLTDPEAGAIDAHWLVDGSLMYSGNAWPSGAMASVEVGDPTLLAGPVPQLVASTENEALTLGPDNPAAARVVEVRVGAAAIPPDGSAVGAISVDLLRRPGSGGSGDRPPVVAIYPLDGPGAVSLSDGGPLPSPAPPGLDPFAGCEPGAACARRFLVTIAWTGEAGEDESFDWRLNVRRVDLVRVWSTPAELSAKVQRRFDVAPDLKPSTVYLEGDATAAAFDAPPQVQLALTTSTTATEPLSRLLPVPGFVTYRAQILESPPSASDGGPTVTTWITPRIPQSGTRPIYGNFVGGDVGVVASVFATPVAGCHVGEACPDLEIATIVSPKDREAPLPTVRFHWSLDLTVYSLTDVSISLSADDRSP
jgi:hypothetical protein